jgi:hypothetical protein
MVLRATLLVDGGVFLLAALLNLGGRIPLGFTELSFPVPIWQAGLGEAVIGVLLSSAAITRRGTLAWLAFGLSVVGIAFGLRSAQVQGPAREIHILLVPLALLCLRTPGIAPARAPEPAQRAVREDSPGVTVVNSADSARTRWQPMTIAIAALMTLGSRDVRGRLAHPLRDCHHARSAGSR